MSEKMPFDPESQNNPKQDTEEEINKRIAKVRKQLEEENISFETLAKEEKLELLGLTEEQYFDFIAASPEECKKFQITYEEYRKYKNYERSIGSDRDLRPTTDSKPTPEIAAIEEKIIEFQDQILFELGLHSGPAIYNAQRRFGYDRNDSKKTLRLFQVIKSDIDKYFDSDISGYIVEERHNAGGSLFVQKKYVLESLDRIIDELAKEVEVESYKSAERAEEEPK